MSEKLVRVWQYAGTLSLVMFAAAACGGKSESAQTDTVAAPAAAHPAVAATSPSDTSVNVRGTIASLSPTQVVITTRRDTVKVNLTQPFQVFDREPGKLSDVKDNVFIGVTTVKQSDGTEQATEIHIFPEEMRGLGEGSRMMPQNQGGGAGNRMTNGAVSGSRMSNGSASQSRMSNGNVSSSKGSSLVVQYAGGTQNVSVPPNTPVSVIRPVSKPLAVGDRVVVLAKRSADGTLTANRAMLAANR